MSTEARGGIPTERQCICCGFASENGWLFEKTSNYERGRHFPDSWVCRSEKKCRERTGT